MPVIDDPSKLPARRSTIYPARFAKDLEGRSKRALTDALGLTQFQDPHHYQTMFTRYAEVTPADIQRVANKYLSDARRLKRSAQVEFWQDVLNTLAEQKAAKAAQIRAALFPLAGSKAIPFGEALKYANTVSQKLGVPPAFLLAILKQETNIGANVGTCYMTNADDASGVNTRTNSVVSGVMKLSRDVQPFLTITDRKSVV